MLLLGKLYYVYNPDEMDENFTRPIGVYVGQHYDNYVWLYMFGVNTKYFWPNEWLVPYV